MADWRPPLLDGQSCAPQRVARQRAKKQWPLSELQLLQQGTMNKKYAAMATL